MIVPEGSYTGSYQYGDRVYLLSRDAAGKRLTREVPAEWVSYFRQEDIDAELLAMIKKSRHVRTVKDEPGGWIRVGFVNAWSRAECCQNRKSPIKQLGVPTYEADVHPTMRVVVDAGLRIAKPRRLFVDIETDSRVPFGRKEEARILSWVGVTEEGHALWGVLEEDTDRAERKLLRGFWEAVEPYDQIPAWSGDRFDFPMLEVRSEARGCEVNLRNWLFVDHLEVFARHNKHAAESGEEKQSMALENIAQAVVGKGKEPTPPAVVARFGNKPMGALTYPLWAAGGEWREMLLRYNYRDADLLRLIEEKTGYLALFDAICEVCRVFGDTRGLNPTRQMDGFMLRLGVERGHHFPTRKRVDEDEEEDQYKGAYVLDPQGAGVMKGIHVCDFAAFYPSIILSWNMSPDTKGRVVPDGIPVREGECRAPLTGLTFGTGRRGILPESLEHILNMRKHWTALKASLPPGTPEWHDADRKSTAYKVEANSFYGVVGSIFSRFHDRTIAESVTQTAQWLILKTIEAAEARGWKAVYGDTDSVFVGGCTRAEFEAFVVWCNGELYPGLVRGVGCVENHIKLAYEKEFERVVFVSAKRYVGRFSHYKGKAAAVDSKPEIKGLEWKRGDASLLGRQLQGQVIDLLCGGMNLVPGVRGPTEELEHYYAVVHRARDRVLNEPLTLDEVKRSQSLGKEVRDYAQKKKKDGTLAAQPPHVVVAKLLEECGEDVGAGTRVEYVVVDGRDGLKVIPGSKYTGVEADRFYLWEKLVYPPTQRLLEAAFPDRPWKDLLKVRPAKPKAAPKRGKPNLKLVEGTAA